MKISKEELLHIAKLSDLEIKENEIDEYLKNLEDILNYTETFDNIDKMMENAPEVDRNMFKIPKVL